MLRRKRGRGIVGALVMALAVVAALIFPAYALAVDGDDTPTGNDDTITLDDEPTENPVADNVTRLLVNKLAADTHDYVSGAHLVIYPQSDPNDIVADWVSSSTSHELARTLDINTPYVLHEVSVPEPYGLAKDVVFELYSEDFNTTGRIISGGDGGNAEFQIISGDGPDQAFVISLYDPVVPREDKREVHSQREVGRTAETLAKTGDLFNQPLFWAVAAAGAAALAYGIYRRRKAQ